SLNVSLEVGDVYAHCRRLQAHRRAVRNEHTARRRSGRFQLSSKGGEGGSQTDAALFDIGVGPEAFNEVLARRGAVLVEGEVSQQAADLMGVKAAHGLLT